MCKADLAPGLHSAAFPCGHVFCKSCVERWNQARCAICRGEAKFYLVRTSHARVIDLTGEEPRPLCVPCKRPLPPGRHRVLMCYRIVVCDDCPTPRCMHQPPCSERPVFLS